MNEKQKPKLSAILYFDSMLTPIIINFVYLLLMFGVVLGASGLILEGEVIASLVVLVLGGLFVRILCELLIVLFQINSNIQKIADRS
ncbi:DUF4282 domain-containing protein [Micavibrio aeruginosavorus]|uniref:DUF4282 domain-containing protein n=1 Tax=Micavibrio aeruginosavorus TaxID=349221 RepID=UPI003F4AB14A